MTQTLIIHVIRTNRIPFLQSRASWPLLVNTAMIMGIGAWLPDFPVCQSIRIRAVAGAVLASPPPDAFAYVALTQFVKVALIRARWIS